MTAEHDSTTENVQPIPHVPGTYMHTDGTVETYPRHLRGKTYDADLHRRFQERPSIFQDRRK